MSTETPRPEPDDLMRQVAAKLGDDPYAIAQRQAEWDALDAVVEEFVKRYEWDAGEDGYHEPTDGERILIEDCIQGLLADDDFMRTIAQVYPVRTQFAVSEKQAIPEGMVRVPMEHALTTKEIDTKLLAAWTPERYAGKYPPYINMTMVRMQGDVLLTVRLPTVFAAAAGATSSVRFTRETWREFMNLIESANRVFKACDELDAMM